MPPIVQVVASNGLETVSFVERLTGQKSQSSCTWHLATKYYEIDVEVQQASFKELLTDANWEALVLVVDQSSHESFLEAKNWFEATKDDFSKPAIALVVIKSMQQGESVPSWFEEEGAALWCIENGFEWIRVSTEDQQWDDQLHEDEGHGMRRVVEALEAHVWPGCTLKSRSGDNTTVSVSSPAAAPSFQAEGEEMEDAFEKLLVEMSSARERLQKLSDQDRRQGAADLAMKLAEYFVDD